MKRPPEWSPLARTRAFRGLALLGMIACAASCSDDSTAPQRSGVDAVEIRAPNDSLFYGRSMQMVAVALGDPAVVSRPEIRWQSSDTLAVTVNGEGLVTAVGLGSAVVSATVADRRAEYVVRAVPMRVAADGSLKMAAQEFYGNICGLTEAGHAACLVSSTYPDTIPRLELLPDALNHVFVSFGSGFDADCGLKADGSLWCTRLLRDYVLATRAEVGLTTQFHPVRTTHRFSSFGIGGRQSLCGISVQDNVVHCWGETLQGVLGRPFQTNVTLDSLVLPVVDAPPLARLSMNLSSSCGVDLAGRAICWGYGARGRGMRALPDTTVYPAVPVVGANTWHARVRDDAPPFVSVAGDDYFTCGLTAVGEAHCWGLNTDGQLGIGSTAATTAVERVATTLRFRALYAFVWGESQMCGVTTEDAIYCWGRVSEAAPRGALGPRRTLPVPVLPGLAVDALILNYRRHCAVTRAGGLVCW